MKRFSITSAPFFSYGTVSSRPSSRYTVVETLLSRYRGVHSLKPLRTDSLHASMYLSNKTGSAAFSMPLGSAPVRSLLCSHDSTKGFQPTSDSFMYRMPALLTVAGVAFLREFISKTMRMASDRGMRSLDTRVSTLLSSMTVFMDSIQTASMSPSSTTHLYDWWSWNPCSATFLAMPLMMMESTPSFQSLDRVMYPYSSSPVTDFGLTGS
mmetsp:Transcript_18169/g.40278  ORF Transcript_18169/g.40278 Transcript_18169/m.40278 type:complete len:210 (-) Transcript_18169:916-1545(-)